MSSESLTIIFQLPNLLQKNGRIMSFAIRNYINVDAIYGAARTYISPLYNQYTLVANSQGYSKLPVFGEFIKRHANTAFNAGKTFLWTYKEYMAGGTVIAIALYKIHHYWKNRPEYPVVKMVSSLDAATLHIENPKEKPLPVNATLIFCIDTSGSMDSDERIGAVKSALNKVLDHAQSVVNGCPAAQISFEIIGFNTAWSVIAPLTNLTDGDKESKMQAVKKQITALTPSGYTKILAGLDKASQDLTTTRSQGSRTIVLLTDGNDSIDQGELSNIHARIASAGASLFAIGIGKEHKKATLKQIVTSKAGSFKGKYIDTTAGKETIKGAIAAIYGQAIASFSELELSATGLGQGTWTVIGAPTGQTTCSLGPLSNGSALNKVIKINSDSLPASLDLSTVTFYLTFRDPKGRKGKISLPWNPTTIIDPAIIKAARVC